MFAVFLSRVFHGTDIRTVGSGNPGFTNVYRGVNRATGLLVLVLDIAKGSAAVGIAMHGLARIVSAPPETLGVVAGVGALAGHAWPLFAGFRGGKGVATAAGVFGALAPLAIAAAALVWGVVLGTSGYMSVASIAAAVVFPVAVVLAGGASSLLTGVSIGVGILIVVRHRANLARLARRQEPRFSVRKR